jgi:hypothetical protein
MSFLPYAGSVLAALLKEHLGLEITALVRKPEDGPKLQALSPSLKFVVGDMTNVDLISTEARNADIVLNALNCDDVPLTEAVIKGLEERAASGPTLTPVLVHTGGTGVTEVGNDGNFIEGPTYDVSETVPCQAQLYLSIYFRTAMSPLSSRSRRRTSTGPLTTCE